MNKECSLSVTDYLYIIDIESTSIGDWLFLTYAIIEPNIIYIYI